MLSNKHQITLAVEDWREALSDSEWLFDLHWKAVAMDQDKMPLALDVDKYAKLQDMGMLHAVIARDNSNRIIGYHWSFVHPHLHYKTTLCAFQDVYFMHPDWRKGMNGVNLFRFVEESLHARGVKKLYGAHKIKLDIGNIFKRLGWRPAENHFTKWIG